MSSLKYRLYGASRKYPCPTCGRQNSLTYLQYKEGYQCSKCADHEPRAEQIDFCPVCYGPIFSDEHYVLYDGRCYCPSCFGDVEDSITGESGHMIKPEYH